VTSETQSLYVFPIVLGILILSMAVYAVRGPKQDADQKKKSGQLFLGAGDFLLHWFMWAVDPLTRLSIRLGLTPDFYNYVGLALGVGSGFFIANGQLEAGGWAIALCGVADILDGRIARLTGVASDFGDFIDSTFDRYVEIAACLGFLVLLSDHPWGPFLAASAMAGSLVVSYTRARGEALGILCTGGLMQRGERMVLSCLGCLSDAGASRLLGWPRYTVILWILGTIGVTTLITASHRTVWIALRLKEKEEAARHPAVSPESAGGGEAANRAA
jgi:CDP-diacylglycerol--glycerol-3-phosphate 3-phosphatidyltransferase